MKALSIQQPWAWAIICAGKDVENRSWRKAGCGGSWKKDNPGLYQARELVKSKPVFAIHCGQKFDDDGYDFLRLKLGAAVPWRGDFRLGGIVGTARLIDVVTAHSSEWFEGPIGLVLAEAKPVPFVPFKGALGFFDVPDELVKLEVTAA